MAELDADFDFNNVLFLCVANSARSQMAEGLARARFGDNVVVRSAGSRATQVNPLAVAEVPAAAVDLVITLCADEVCPAFLGDAARLHWPLADPDRADEALTNDERLSTFRATRDDLAARIEELATAGDAPLDRAVTTV